MAGRLEGKVAVISGSATGIGQAIAIRMASEGAHVVVNYIGDASVADATNEKVQSFGVKSICVQADVSKVDQSANLIEQAWLQLGGCDILVNNAGVERNAPFWDVTEHDYDLVVDVNLKGVFFLTQAFVRKAKDANRKGRIINISSVHEDMAFPNFASYCASKGGVRMLTRNLAVELGPLGITINNVAPGAIVTPINRALLADQPKLDALLKLIPLGRMGSVDDVSGMVAYLASDEGGYVTGSTFIIDGGLIRNYHEQ